MKLTKNELESDKVPGIKLFKDPVFGDVAEENTNNQTNLTHLGNREIINFPIKTIISQQDNQVQ